jgi:hypothetical protein
MGKGDTKAISATTVQPPAIFAATLGTAGSVVKCARLTQAQAEQSRRAGKDVVVCGANKGVNRRTADLIERNANTSTIRHAPHTKSSGPKALPHFQPRTRPPAGHTFYETTERKAI